MYFLVFGEAESILCRCLLFYLLSVKCLYKVRVWLQLIFKSIVGLSKP